MRFPAWSAPAVLLASFALMPLSAAAQQFTDGTSPALHAWFEYQYARQATYVSVSAAHREQVVAIVQSFEKGSVSQDDASKHIDDVLSSDEKNAVVTIARSFSAAMQASVGPVQASLVPSSAPDDAGRFLLLLLQTSSSASPATVQ